MSNPHNVMLSFAGVMSRSDIRQAIRCGYWPVDVDNLTDAKSTVKPLESGSAEDTAAASSRRPSPGARRMSS
jgi:hypothetical protein